MAIYSIDADSLKNAFDNKEPSFEYQSPISINYHEMETQIKQTVEGKIFAAVGVAGIDIDREGLIRAIEADRKVQEGTLVEVVRCKNCKWLGMQRIEDRAYLRCNHPDAPISGHECASLFVEPDWFCPLGERSRIR